MLAEPVPQVEPYWVEEMFLDLTGRSQFPDLVPPVAQADPGTSKDSDLIGIDVAMIEDFLRLDHQAVWTY